MRAAGRAIDTGEKPGDPFGLSFPNEGHLNQVLSEKRIEFLRLIAREEPASLNETARLLDRGVHAVHDNLTELADLGLIRFEEEGTAKRPVVWYDEIVIRDADERASSANA